MRSWVKKVLLVLSWRELIEKVFAALLKQFPHLQCYLFIHEAKKSGLLLLLRSKTKKKSPKCFGAFLFSHELSLPAYFSCSLSWALFYKTYSFLTHFICPPFRLPLSSSSIHLTLHTSPSLPHYLSLYPPFPSFLYLPSTSPSSAPTPPS